MYRPLKIFAKDKTPKVRTTVTEAVKVTLSHTETTPEGELAKWQEVLKELTKTPAGSPQEALARETVKGRIKDLKRKLRTPQAGKEAR